MTTTLTLTDIRPELLAFVLLMEQRLRDKDADKQQSWKAMSEQDLGVHVTSKTMLLDTAVRNGYAGRIRHAVDLANFAMMIVDVAGGLPEIDPMQVRDNQAFADALAEIEARGKRIEELDRNYQEAREVCTALRMGWNECSRDKKELERQLADLVNTSKTVVNQHDAGLLSPTPHDSMAINALRELLAEHNETAESSQC